MGKRADLLAGRLWRSTLKERQSDVRFPTYKMIFYFLVFASLNKNAGTRQSYDLRSNRFRKWPVPPRTAGQCHLCKTFFWLL
jgi:hypothetical protein